jgi:hypothetical protein
MRSEKEKKITPLIKEETQNKINVLQQTHKRFSKVFNELVIFDEKMTNMNTSEYYEMCDKMYNSIK